MAQDRRGIVFLREPLVGADGRTISGYMGWVGMTAAGVNVYGPERTVFVDRYCVKVVDTFATTFPERVGTHIEVICDNKLAYGEEPEDLARED